MGIKGLKGKMLLTGILAAIMLIFASVGAFASEANDLEGHWAGNVITEWIDSGLATGYPDGAFKPDNPITRAEFFALTNRAFGYTKTRSGSFSDVSPQDWFAGEIEKAVAAGYVGGYPDGTIKPINAISRQETAAILSKILSPKTADTSYIDRYTDKDSIPDWSIQAVNSVAGSGYMGGYPDGSFQPARVITRAESIIVLNRAAGALYKQAGTYGPAEGTATIAGNVTISTKDITLQNTVIAGNLYLTEGIGDGHVTLENVRVQGTTNVKGGGIDSIIIINSTLGPVVINVPDGAKVRLVAEGTTTVGTVEAKTESRLEENNLSGQGFQEVVVQIPPGAAIELKGDFQQVKVEVAEVKVEVQQGTIQNLSLTPAAQGAGINLASGTTVQNLTVDTTAAVTGQGTIQTANLNSQGVTIDQKPTTTTVAQGVTASVGGSSVTGTGTTAGQQPASGGNSGGGGSGGDDNDNDNDSITISAVTGADVGVSQGSIEFAYSFTAGSAAVTFGQAKAAPYYLDAANSTVQIKAEDASPAVVSDEAALSTLVISDDGVAVFAGFNEMAAAFGDFTNAPTHIKLRLASKISVGGKTVSNPWTYDTDWISFESAELNVFNIYGDKESLYVKNNLGDVIAGAGLENITADLTLDSAGPFGSAITWESGDTGVIANDGTVTRPDPGEGNVAVTLTATLTKGGLTETKEYALTVLAETITDEQSVAAAKAALAGTASFNPVEGVNDNIMTMVQAIVDAAADGVTATLIGSGSGSSIEVPSGEITYGYADVTGSLSLLLTKNNASDYQTVSVTIPATSLTSSDVTLSVFTIGGLDVTGLEGLAIGLPDGNPGGAELYVDDFTDFSGIAAVPTDDAAVINKIVKNNIDVTVTAASESISEGDRIIVWVIAESGAEEFYSVYALAAPTYSIGLSASNPTDLGTETAGYGVQTPMAVTVTRIGTGNITGLTAALSGTDAGSFTVVQPTATTLNSTTETTTFTVVPKHGLAAGSYTANVAVTADEGISESFVITFVVQAANSAPVAANDTGTINEDSTDLINVLANDTDVDGDTLAITGFTQGSHGTVEQEGDSLRYTPADDYNGADSFTYEISDSNGGTATATVNVTVNSVNDLPVAANDTGTINEDSTDLINVLANDTDVDGDTLAITGFTQGSHGTVEQEGDSLRYTPADDYNGADSFTYEISDSNGGTATATVSVTVNSVNDAPTIATGEAVQTGNATPAADSGTPAAVAYTADMSDWFEDADAGDTLTYAVEIAVDESSNDVSGDVNIAGSNITYTAAAAQAGKDVTIVIKANDGSADSTGSVTISVTVAAVPA